jgi:hypothetical protein
VLDATHIYPAGPLHSPDVYATTQTDWRRVDGAKSIGVILFYVYYVIIYFRWTESFLLGREEKFGVCNGVVHRVSLTYDLLQEKFVLL